MSNAQVAALGSIALGVVVMLLTRNNQPVIAKPLPPAPKGEPATA